MDAPFELYEGGFFKSPFTPETLAERRSQLTMSKIDCWFSDLPQMATKAYNEGLGLTLIRTLLPIVALFIKKKLAIRHNIKKKK